MITENADIRVRLANDKDGDLLSELALTLSTLPLLVRYGVDASRLSDDLRTLARATAGRSSQQLLLAETKDSQTLVGLSRIAHGDGGGGVFGRGGYLKLIALRPGHEGRGIGQLLMAAVEKLIAERAPDLFLLTSDFNSGAQRFYERAGYRRTGELPDFVCAGITEIIYWKRLR